MNVTEMVHTLSLRLEDAATINFTDAMKLQALNNGQVYAAHRLVKPYLTELQAVQESLTATSGEYAMSSLTYNVLGGEQGIVAVKINGGKWCTEISVKDLKKTENFYLAGTVNNPLYWVFNNIIYVSNGQTNPSIDVYYYKVPTDMIYKFDIGAGTAKTAFLGDDNQNLSGIDTTYVGIVAYSVNQNSYHVVTAYVGATREFTVEPAAAVNWADDEIYFISNDFDLLAIEPSSSDADMEVETCALNKSLHELVVTLAEMECWQMDAQKNRADTADVIAKIIIDTLNGRYVEAEGIGTKGDYRYKGERQ